MTDYATKDTPIDLTLMPHSQEVKAVHQQVGIQKQWTGHREAGGNTPGAGHPDIMAQSSGAGLQVGRTQTAGPSQVDLTDAVHVVDTPEQDAVTQTDKRNQVVCL